MDDSKIVSLFEERDETAILYTSQKYGSRLRNLAYRIVNDHEIACECENDTYLEAWNRIPPHNPTEYLYAFLSRITRNIAIDRCRKGNRKKRKAHIVELSSELESCIPAPDDTESRIDGVILGEVISSYLHTLPETQRNIFIRRYWYCDSILEISIRFAISQNKAKSILYRCRYGLREYLMEEGYTL